MHFKKFGLIIFMFSLVGCSSNAGTETEAFFRDTNWGMTKQEVKEVETAKFVKQDEYGGYDFIGEIGDYKAEINYIFDRDTNKLYFGNYRIAYNTEKEAKDNHELLKKQISEKYSNEGKPGERNSMEKEYEHEWELSNTHIHLRTVFYSKLTILSYTEIDHHKESELEQEEEEKKSEEELKNDL